MTMLHVGEKKDKLKFKKNTIIFSYYKSGYD